MKKVLACLILLASFFSGICFSEEAEVSAYDRIEMSFMKEEIVNLFGEGVREGEYEIFSGEVMCAFYESGRLMAKGLVYEAVCDIAPVADIPLESLKKLKQGAMISEITELFGCEGIEIMRINLSDEENAGVRLVLAWQNAEKITVQALFELDDGEWVLFAVAESPAQ